MPKNFIDDTSVKDESVNYLVQKTMPLVAEYSIMGWLVPT